MFHMFWYVQELNLGRDQLAFAAHWADIHAMGRKPALALPGAVLLQR